KNKQRRQQSAENDPKQLWQAFVRHLDFLKDTGYADKCGRLTDDGVWASHLRVDHPLMIAEGFRRRVLPKNDPMLLAAIMTLFVNEREFDEKVDKSFTPKALIGSFFKVKKGLASFSARMAQKGFESRPLVLSPAAMICAWASGLPWEKVLNIGIKDVFPEAASAAGEAIDLIMRYPVVMDYDI
ncbi:MAG: ATP-dependent DNA helicase, partial [Deltaproteobacteria bacterium]